MPPRQQYHLHRYAARPSSKAPADAQSRTALAKRAAAARDRLGRRTPVCVTRGFLTDLKRLATRWAHQANNLERAAGAKFLHQSAERRGRVETLRRVAENLRELIEATENGEGV